MSSSKETLSVAPEQALKLGWSIIPVGRRKLPFSEGLPVALDESGQQIVDEESGRLKRTWKPYQTECASVDELKKWKSLNPAGYAVVCGAISNLVVIDFDGADGAKLVKEWKIKPHVRTGSGGFHLYVKHPGWRVQTLNSKAKKELGNLYPGLDIRADGGYAVFCGYNEVGHYEWLRKPELDEIKVLPEKVRLFLGLERTPEEPETPSAKFCFDPSGRISSNRLLEDALIMVKRNGEGRNNAGFWLACQLRDNKYSEAEGLELVREFARACPASNAKGQQQEYSDIEVRASVREAFSAPPREPWAFKDTKPHPKAEASILAAGQTKEKLIEFLKGFKPLYKSKDRRIYFQKQNYSYSCSEVYSFDGALDLVRSSPEFQSVKDQSEKSLIVLGKEMFKIAALRLAATLPDEEPAHDGEAVQTVRESIIQFLILPRVFYSRSGTPTNQSYASWLTLLEPDDAWRQCANHSVYGRADSKGVLRLAVKSEFLLEKCPRISRVFSSAVPAGKFLLQNDLIQRTPDGASLLIKCSGRAIRTWELSTGLVEEGCGTSISEPQNTSIARSDFGNTVTDSDNVQRKRYQVNT